MQPCGADTSGSKITRPVLACFCHVLDPLREDETRDFRHPVGLLNQAHAAFGKLGYARPCAMRAAPASSAPRKLRLPAPQSDSTFPARTAVQLAAQSFPAAAILGRPVPRWDGTAAAEYFTTTYASAILGSVQLKSLLSNVVLTVMTSGANT